jgi:hypothetical protein
MLIGFAKRKPKKAIDLLEQICYMKSFSIGSLIGYTPAGGQIAMQRGQKR